MNPQSQQPTGGNVPPPPQQYVPGQATPTPTPSPARSGPYAPSSQLAGQPTYVPPQAGQYPQPQYGPTPDGAPPQYGQYGHYRQSGGPGGPGGANRRLGRGPVIAALVVLAVVAFALVRGAGPRTDAQGAGGGGAGCAAQSDVVCGTVVDTQGRPLSGVDVEIAGTAMYSARTDAHGAYSVQVMDGLYQVHADLEGTYQGATWVLPLYPTDGHNDEVSASGGIVKDFAWRLTGPIPGMDPSEPRDYYGATVKLLVEDPLVLPTDATQSSLPPDSVLTITLTPQSSLVDGSAGRPVTYTRTVRAANNQGTQGGFDDSQVLGDLSLGTYTIAGTLATPDGASDALVFAAGGQAAYAQSATVTFQPAATSAGRGGIIPQTVRVSTASWH